MGGNKLLVLKAKDEAPWAGTVSPRLNSCSAQPHLAGDRQLRRKFGFKMSRLCAFRLRLSGAGKLGQSRKPNSIPRLCFSHCLSYSEGKEGQEGAGDRLANVPASRRSLSMAEMHPSEKTMFSRGDERDLHCPLCHCSGDMT